MASRIEITARRIVPKRYHRAALRFLAFISGTLQKLWSVVPGDSTLFGPPRGISDEETVATTRGRTSSRTVCRGAEHHVFQTWRPLREKQPQHWKFVRASSLDLPEACIYSFKNARIVGRRGFLIDAEDRLVGFLSFEIARRHDQQSIFMKVKLPRIAQLSLSVGVPTCDGMDNYFHWLFEVIPRIHLLKESGLKIEKYYVPGDRAFQTETLRLVGIATSDAIEPSESAHLRCNEVIVPTRMPGISACAVAFLRQEFLRESVIGPQPLRRRRLYISRATAPGRRVRNEEVLSVELTRMGFEVAVLEKLSVAQQVRLFHEAAVVIGPHGAGMSNLVFCQAQTLVIEMFAPEYVNAVYGQLAGLCELRYLYYICHGRTVQPGQPDVVRQDMFVDTAEFIPLVRAATETTNAYGSESGR